MRKSWPKTKKKNLFVKFRSGFSHRKVGWIVGFFLVFWGKGYEKNCAACHANQETNNRLCSVLLQFFLATTMCWIFFLPHSALRIHRCCCWRGCCKLFFFFCCRSNGNVGTSPVYFDNGQKVLSSSFNCQTDKWSVGVKMMRWCDGAGKSLLTV